MRSKQFWLDLVERALKTFAQALLAVLTVGVPIWEINWAEGVGIAATAAVISALTSIVSTGKGNPATASLVDVPGRHRRKE